MYLTLQKVKCIFTEAKRKRKVSKYGFSTTNLCGSEREKKKIVRIEQFSIC